MIVIRNQRRPTSTATDGPSKFRQNLNEAIASLSTSVPLYLVGDFLQSLRSDDLLQGVTHKFTGSSQSRREAVIHHILKEYAGVFSCPNT